MAKLTRVDEDGSEESVEIVEGDEVIDGAEELGVPFGCQDGRCGSCLAEVTEGYDNLSEMTQEELDMELEKPHRLMCQCKIKNGEVKIRF